MIIMRVNALSAVKTKKSSTDRVIARSKDLYGFTPEEKSDENMEWMLQNGYIQEKRHRRGVRGRRRKAEET